MAYKNCPAVDLDPGEGGHELKWPWKKHYARPELHGGSSEHPDKEDRHILESELAQVEVSPLSPTCWVIVGTCLTSSALRR